MYEAYWQLQAKPFEEATDTRFFFPGQAYQSALLKLRYAIESRRGAALLAGPSGCGKSLLARALLSQLPEDFRPLVHLVFPQLPADQFVAYVADELDGTAGDASQSLQQNVRRIERILISNSSAGRHAVFVIDEAQLLRGAETLESLRLLLNFEHEARPCMTLLLVGQTSLVPVLSRQADFDSRLGVKCMLRAFSSDETAGYVNHRLAAAGAKRPLFDRDALAALFEISQGNARRINRLCDLALLIGYAEERHQIGRAQIESVADELLARAA